VEDLRRQLPHLELVTVPVSPFRVSYVRDGRLDC
jgi:hypothetical protein